VVSNTYSGYFDHVFVNGGSGVGSPDTLTKVFNKDCKLITNFKKSYYHTPFLKDLTGDGCQEFIYGGKAWQYLNNNNNNNNSFKWVALWENDDLMYMDEVEVWDFENGFCYNEYRKNIICIDSLGHTLIKKKVMNESRNIAIGDFDGDGINNDVATAGAILVPLQLFIGNEFGDEIAFVEPDFDLRTSAPRELVAGQLDYSSATDEIVFSMENYLFVYNADGTLLWYFDFGGGGYTDDLLIKDINNNGVNEIIAGHQDSLYIVSNEGSLLFNTSFNGDFGNWHGSHPTMQIYDLNNDCCKEILFSVGSGTFYIYGLKECPKKECKTKDNLYEITNCPSFDVDVRIDNSNNPDTITSLVVNTPIEQPSLFDKFFYLSKKLLNLSKKIINKLISFIT
jgi:hypothetical protein